MKKIRLLLALTLIWGSVATPIQLWAADTQAIEDRLNALEEEVKVLKRQLELAKEDNDKKAKEVPIVTASAKDGFSIKSPDDSFKLKIRGIVQADARIFTDTDKTNSTTDTISVRRARPILEGTVAKNFDFYIMPDFGSGAATLVDGYGEFKLAPWAKLRGGKFKAPFGLERFQSDAVSNFTEIGLPGNLVPNREVGFQLSGDILGETTNYSLGIFNGSADIASSTSQDTDNNNDKDFVGRVFVQPFKNRGPDFVRGLGVGFAGSVGHNESSTLPTYKSTGQVNIFSYASGVTADGPHIRISPQVSYYNGSLGLLGEYVKSELQVVRTSGGSPLKDTFVNTAWQVSGNYVLTGELASFKGITPRTNFDLAQGTWGALEAVGRVGHLNIDNSIFDNGFGSNTTSVSGADAWGVGLNWYPSKNYRLSLDFEQTQFFRGAAALADRKTENAILTRFQVTY